MGDEVQMLKFHQDLLCRAGFQHICVTAAPTMPQTSHGNSLKHMSWEPGKIIMIPLTYSLKTANFSHAASTRSGGCSCRYNKSYIRELQGFNPFSTLKYSFWYFIGIVLLMICCFCLLELKNQKATPRIKHRNALGAFKK
jgi:hypothetical protein